MKRINKPNGHYLVMRKELRFEKHLKPTRMVKQIKNIRKEVNLLKKNQEHILQILSEYELTGYAKKALKESRATPENKYISHEDVKK